MTSATFSMTIRWSLPFGESRPLVSTLQGLMVPNRSRPGCMACILNVGTGTQQVVITYVEEWKTEGDLKRQLHSHEFGVLAELMERASAQPAIEFSLAGSTRGLDYAREVCGCADRKVYPTRQDEG